MLKTRVYTSIVLVAILLYVLFAAPPWAGVALLDVVLLVGGWEWAAFAGCTQPWHRAGYVIATVVLFYAVCARITPDSVLQFMGLAVVWWIVAAVRIVRVAPPLSSRLTLAAGWLTLLPAIAAVVRLFSGHNRLSGPVLFLILLGLVAAADVGAYFAGRRFGRHKLAPAVSPGKTWEGVAGGALLVTVIAVVIAVRFGFPPVGFSILAAVILCASIVGDLTESLFKRSVGLKDSGIILPGHGGILDRIDGLVAAAPCYVLGLAWMGILQ